ncbi:transcriptional regulator [Comamonas serinivorans]|uniref:Transcriptional regulator n=1 Tax=Comamonas serinivorans TaxID=1082851 RepID=A0A1Y0EKV7_9BURK|nr:helix-turn-helix transcriptional regulator [Comamonas serinivorans]ARU04206.1 transcriptional regulator [Comamonas serinivorans]
MAVQFLLDFGLAVRQQREARGWSQELLAEHAGLNRCYIGEIERGQVVPSLLTLQKLAHAMQLRPTELMACGETIASRRHANQARLMAIAG